MSGLGPIVLWTYLNELYFIIACLTPLECHSCPYSQRKHSMLLDDLFPWGQVILSKHTGFSLSLLFLALEKVYFPFISEVFPVSAKAKCHFAMQCPEPARASAWREQHFRKHCSGDDYFKSKMKIVRLRPLFHLSHSYPLPSKHLLRHGKQVRRRHI